MRLPSLPSSSGAGPWRSSRVTVAVAAAIGGAMLILATVPLGTIAQDRDRGPRDVEGPNWQLLEYREDGELVLVPPGVTAELYLWDRVVSGSSACGAFRSSYTVGADRLLIDPPEIEPRDCDAEGQALDEVFFPALQQTSSWETDGSQMTLSDAAGEELLAFTSARVPEDPTIAPWRLSRVTGEGGPQRAVEGSDAVVRFLPGGRVAGKSGCGPVLGSYTTNGTTIRIVDLESRLTDCTGEILTQAQELIDTLPTVTDFSLRPAGLALSDDSSADQLAFVPEIPLNQRTWTPLAVIDADGDVRLDGADLESASVRFQGRAVDGRSVCRLYSGSTLRSGLALTLFGLEPGGGSCRAEEDETAFLDALRSVASHALRGSDLELLDDDGDPVMRLRLQPPLTNVEWSLARMDTAPAGRKVRLRAPVTEQPLTATFVDDGVLVGQTGVDDFYGRYTAGGSQIEIQQALPSGDACRSKASKRTPECRLQARYLGFLQNVDNYVVRDGSLFLLDGSRRLLEFVPSDQVPEPEDAA